MDNGTDGTGQRDGGYVLFHPLNNPFANSSYS